jgi:hypothetical protein
MLLRLVSPFWEPHGTGDDQAPRAIKRGAKASGWQKGIGPPPGFRVAWRSFYAVEVEVE